MSAWRTRTKGALPVTHHGRLEIINGICLAAFRKAVSVAALTDALASFDEDVAEGRYAQTDVLWRATLRRASDISRTQTARLGCLVTRRPPCCHGARAWASRLRHVRPPSAAIGPGRRVEVDHTAKMSPPPIGRRASSLLSAAVHRPSTKSVAECRLVPSNRETRRDAASSTRGASNQPVDSRESMGTHPATRQQEGRL